MLVVTDNGNVCILRKSFKTSNAFITSLGLFDHVSPIDEDEYIKTGKVIKKEEI